MYHVSHGSDEKPPKAKARIQVKKQKVQLPGHQEPIVPPMVKPPDEEDDEPPPQHQKFNSFAYDDATFVYTGTAVR